MKGTAGISCLIRTSIPSEKIILVTSQTTTFRPIRTARTPIISARLPTPRNRAQVSMRSVHCLAITPMSSRVNHHFLRLSFSFQARFVIKNLLHKNSVRSVKTNPLLLSAK